MEIAVLALGCFWGPEIKFGELEGITKTEVGYCGGNNDVTTYEEVCSGNTNTMEGKIIYDSCVNQCNLDASLPDPIDFNTGDAQTDTTDLGMCRNGGDTSGDTGI